MIDADPHAVNFRRPTLAAELALGVFGIAAIIVTIVIVGLCACLKSSKSDIESQNVKSKRESGKRKTGLKVDVDLARSAQTIDLGSTSPQTAQTNGSISTGSGHNGLKGHDRALPEIPGEARVSVMSSSRHHTAAPDDEEDEDMDGLYDVISKRPKRPSATAAQPNGQVKLKDDVAEVMTPGVVNPSAQNPYELVPGDCEPEVTVPVQTATSNLPTTAASPSSAEGNAASQPIYSMPNKGPAYRERQSLTSELDRRASDQRFSSPSDMNSMRSSRRGRGASPIDLARQAFFAETPVPSGPPSHSFGGRFPASDPFTRRSFGRSTPSPSPSPSSTPYSSKSHPYARVKDVSTSPSDSHSPAKDAESVANVSTSSVPPPPVPTKQMTPNDSGHSHQGASSGLSEVPLASGFLGQENHSNRARLPSAEDAMGGADATASGINVTFPTASTDSGAAAGPVKKEPPYHKVTVRESLANVRLREAEEKRRNPFSLVLLPGGSGTDVDYDQINYDQIKSPGASGGTSGNMGGDTGSELYAEIGGAEAPSSQRSSTYAAVGEGTLGDHAPTPPPVDSLKQLTETLDPGYSQIGGGRPRPHSTLSDSSSYSDVDLRSGGAGATSMPIYAKVNKGRPPQKRQTLHGGEDLERMYARVNKPRKSRETGGATSQDTAVTMTGSFPSESSGARPRPFDSSSLLRRHASSASASSSATAVSQTGRGSRRNNDPGYSTIEGAMGSPRGAPMTLDGDHYQVVDDKLTQPSSSSSAMTSAIASVPTTQTDTGSDYDPNYESMGNIARVLPPCDPSADPSAGVAREIVPPLGASGGVTIDGANEQGLVHVTYNDQSKASVFAPRPQGLIREHIYQEISEAKKSPRRKGAKDPGKDSGASAKEQRKSGGGRHSKKDSFSGGRKV